MEAEPSPKLPESEQPQATDTAEAESKYHSYISNQIPWFVHVLWVGFWILAIWYIVSFQLPIIKEEFLSPP